MTATEPIRRSWGVSAAVPVLLLLAAAGAAAWAIGAATAEDRLVAICAAATALVAAGLAWRLRNRLSADADGLTVAGIVGSRSVRWEEVSRMSAPSRQRRGIRSTTIEIDLTDDTLLIFGRFDLGADPGEVLSELRAVAAGQQWSR